MSTERVKEIEEFCSELVKEYLPDYTFRINKRLTATNGRIKYGSKVIEMSYRLASQGTDAGILNNIVHEIAHGLHPKDGHGRLWRNTFIKLGGDGRRTNNYEGVSYEKPAYKYGVSCPKCGVIGRYRRRPKIANRLKWCSCRKCGSSGLTFGEL